MRRQSFHFVSIALLLALPLFAACQKSSTSAATQTLEVHVSETAIQMPTAVPAGTTTFKVINDGATAHNFQIEGPAGHQEAAVEPGKTASLKMVLDPGIYRISVPTNDQIRLEKALNVTARG